MASDGYRDEGDAAAVEVREDADPSPLARRFARFTAALLVADSAAEVLVQVAEAAQQLLSADAVSITVRARDGTFSSPVSTAPVAVELDLVQYGAGAGPCVEAARMHGPGLAASADLATTRAWPEFAAAASARGFVMVVSAALAPGTSDGGAFGALNIYARRARALDVAAQDVALLLATHTALALAHAQAVSFGEAQHGRLRRAADRRRNQVPANRTAGSLRL